MRTISTAQDLVLSSANRATHVRVFIDRGSSDWVDMTTLEGRNWIHSVTYSGNIDSNVATAQISLVREHHDLSLATLMDDSKLNADGTIVDIANPIYVEVAVVADSAGDPQSGDWIEVFRGVIDEIDWSGSPIQLRCRDQGGALASAFIESQVKYPEDPKSLDLVETVMQSILTDNSTGVTLWCPTSPGFYISEYIQKKQSVMAALKALADQSTFALRYIWRAGGVDEFQLKLYSTTRERNAVGTITVSGQAVGGESFVVNATTHTEGAGWTANADPYTQALSMAAAIDAGAEAGNTTTWVEPPTYAIGTITLTGVAVAAETITIGGYTFTAQAAAPTNAERETGLFKVAASTEEQIDEILSTMWYLSTWRDAFSAQKRGTDKIKITWKSSGTAGNSIAFTETLTNGSMDGGGTLGGSEAATDALLRVLWNEIGTAGNTIVFTEAVTNATIDGGGVLGGTISGVDATSLRTFSTDEYYDISRMSLSIQDIRTKVEVIYGRYEDATRASVIVEDTDATTKYGPNGQPIYCSIALAGTDQIDTESEADTLARAILEDLKEPTAEKTVVMPYFWPVELHDYYTFAANNVHYDTAQSLAVVGYSHKLSPTGQCTTELTCRGKPAGGTKRWINNESRGTTGPNDQYLQDGPRNAYIQLWPGTVVIRYDDPRSMDPPISDWKTTNVYMDTTAGFTPSFSNLVASGRQTRFEIMNLDPNTTYYFALQIVTQDDTVGRTVHLRSTTSPDKLPPYTNDPDHSKGLKPTNYNFSSAYKGLEYPPDNWFMEAGDWDNDTIALSQTANSEGQYSVRFESDPSANGDELWSDYFPVEGDTEGTATRFTIRFVVSTNGPTTNPGDQALATYVRFYDQDKNYIDRFSYGALQNNSALSFFIAERTYVASTAATPSDVCYARIQLQNSVAPGSDAGFYFYYHSFRMYRTPMRVYYPFQGITSATVASGAFASIAAGCRAQIANDPWGMDAAGTITIIQSEEYTFRYTTRLTSAIVAGSLVQLRLNRNAGANYYYSPWYTVQNSNDNFHLNINIAASNGDTYVLEAYHNDAVTGNVDFSTTGVVQIENTNQTT